MRLAPAEVAEIRTAFHTAAPPRKREHGPTSEVISAFGKALPTILEEVEERAFNMREGERFHSGPSLRARRHDLMQVAKKISAALDELDTVPNYPIAIDRFGVRALSEATFHLKRWREHLADQIGTLGPRRSGGPKKDHWRAALLHELALWWTRENLNPTTTPNGSFASVAAAILAIRRARQGDLRDVTLRDSELARAIEHAHDRRVWGPPPRAHGTAGTQRKAIGSRRPRRIVEIHATRLRGDSIVPLVRSMGTE
jgi:hypothetical protein